MTTMQDLINQTKQERRAAEQARSFAVTKIKRILDAAKAEGRENLTIEEDDAVSRLTAAKNRAAASCDQLRARVEEYEGAAKLDRGVDAAMRDSRPAAGFERGLGFGANREFRLGGVRRDLTGRADEALRFADDDHQSGRLSRGAREKLERLLAEGPDQVRSAAADWAAVAGHPDYRSAFLKLVRDPQRGHMLWTDAEQAAYQAVESWRQSQQYTRAALGTGGYVLPTTLDPAIMLTSDGSINPLRRLARNVLTATSSWRGITSAGATSEWKTEGAQAADGTPAAAEVEIPVFTAATDAIYSYEVAWDAIELEEQLMMVVSDAMENLQATAFTTGNGTTAPQGIVTGLAGTASEINGGGTEALDSDDPVTLQNALPARFSAGASWLSHIATANTLRFFETANGALLYPELRETPPMMLGKPWYELSNMDGAIDAGATENNYLLIYGDLFRGFTIVDHVGASVEFLPGYGADRRPTGQRHLFVVSRHGSEVVIPQALRMLDVPTTA